jgi:hypothetical protein
MSPTPPQPEFSGGSNSAGSSKTQTHFFTQGITRTSFLSENNGPAYFKKGEETLPKHSSLHLWEESKWKSSGESPDASGNLNYGTTNPSPDTIPFHLKTESNFGLYEKAVNFGNQVCTWNRTLAPFWSLLLTYPSDLHFVARTALMTVVTGVVVNKALEELAGSVNLQEWGARLDKVLQHNLLDGTDPNDPGRVGVNKDFL